jgi:predicted ATPase
MMQKESLIIKNFGPVKEAEIPDVKPFTFLIGESGSGKSTILKVLAMMRHIYKQWKNV